MNITHQNQLQSYFFINKSWNYLAFAFVGGKSLPLNGKDFLKKKDYGKAPNYLNKIKMNIEKDFNMLQEIKAKEEEEKKKEQLKKSYKIYFLYLLIDILWRMKK